MQDAGQLVQDVDLQRRDLAHDLRGEQQLIFGDRFGAMAASGVEVDAFDQFHVVQQRIEGHEIRKAHLVSFGNLSGNACWSVLVI